MSTFDSIKNDYKIPNIVHQTFIDSNLPLGISKIISRNKKMCPGYNFVFYNDNDCENFIKDNFNERIYNAYKKINNVYGAMKADFFRYCVLYKIGGIYLDIKSVIKVPLNKIINKNDICVLDFLRTCGEPYRRFAPTYEQWLLIFAPKHPYLLEMINLMIYYIEIKYVPKIINYNLSTKEKILHVTGPDAFTKAVKNYIKKNKRVLHRSVDYQRYFALNILGESYKKMYHKYNKKHYSQYNEPLYK
jgi:mannosyltransferase OCH1-like enzyme